MSQEGIPNQNTTVTFQLRFRKKKKIIFLCGFKILDNINHYFFNYILLVILHTNEFRETENWKRRRFSYLILFSEPLNKIVKYFL